MKRYSFLYRQLMKISFLILIMSLVLSVVAYAGGVLKEDFSNPNVLGASGSGANWINSAGGYDMIIKDGQLTRDPNGLKAIGVSKVINNNFTTSGSYTCSFDTGMKFDYDGSYVQFIFNNDTSGNYYSLIFTIYRLYTPSCNPSTVNLTRRINSSESVIASVPYVEVPKSATNAPPLQFHIDIRYESTGYITVDCRSSFTNETTRLFDRVAVSPTTITGGKIGVSTKYTNTWFDNFVIVNDTYSIQNSLFSNEPNNHVNVSAKAYVPGNFQSATLLAAAYDSGGRLVDVKSRAYTASDKYEDKLNFKEVLDTGGISVSNVKYFLMDSFNTLKPLCIRADGTVDDLADVDNPEYIPPANIPHANVVTEAKPVSIPSDLTGLVVKTYPEGKMKAVLFSFDDGGSNIGTIFDHDYVVPMLNQLGLKSAFNVNKKDGEINGIVMGKDSNGVLYGSGNTDGDFYKQEMRSLYEGHEVANHSKNHLSDGILSKENYRNEIGLSKTLFENLYGKEVAGYVHAGGTNTADPIIAPPEWRIEYLKYVGYRYARNGPLSMGSTPTSLVVDIPYNFFNWNPTLKLTDSGVNIDPNAAMNAYVNLDPNNDMKVFFGWGHGWEMGNYNWQTKTVTTNTNLNRLQNFCQIVHDNLDVLWNPTPIQFVDYVNASRLIQLSKDAQGNITVYNPSREITVWLKIRGINTPVSPGETIVK